MFACPWRTAFFLPRIEPLASQLCSLGRWVEEYCLLTRLASKNFAFMSNFCNNSFGDNSLPETLSQPMMDMLIHSRYQRFCPELPDAMWLNALLRRTMTQTPSGRALLQKIADCGEGVVTRSNFFESLKSDRRLHLVQDISRGVEQLVQADDDPFHSVVSLDNFDIYAGDGHYVEHACHDERIEGRQFASGDLFGLNLRTHALFHMTSTVRDATRKREHDMHALKRIDMQVLRRNAKKGKKVIWVWDKAGIDTQQWTRWKDTAGVYFISRAKDNMHTDIQQPLDYDKNDLQNTGVIAYGLITVAKTALRCVHYQCPVSKKLYYFLTTLTTLQPGIIAHLYRARWDIEKVFDEIKRKLGEDKSWASSTQAKNIHAEFRALSHNLTLLFERKLKTNKGITNPREDKRREKRIQKDTKKAQENGTILAPLACSLMRRVTQRVLIFIRWIQNNYDSNRPLNELLDPLRRHFGLEA